MAEPRRVKGRLLLVANLVAANAAAAACVLAAVRPSTFGDAVQLPLSSGATWLVLLPALLLLLGNFGFLVRRSPAPAPRTYVQSETPTGPVRVAREALEAGLRAAGESLPEITRLRVAVECSQQKRVLVQGHFQCAEGTSNHNASQRLRAALRDRFADMVHLGDGVRAEFELEFQGFVGKLAKKGADNKAALEPEPPPFTGPQYPIDEDEGGGN